MLKFKINNLLIAVAFIITAGCNNATNNFPGQSADRLGKASRENKNGWVYVHLEGSPSDIGYQHGYLLSERN